MRPTLRTAVSLAALVLLGAACGGGEGTCGDGVCGSGESASSCPADCTECGNGTCETGEDSVSCAADCPSTCGNGACEPGEDEQDATNACPADCATRARCGNDLCEVGETAASCPHDCQGGTCGNGTCDDGEDGAHCPQDCFECSLIATATGAGQGCSRDEACGDGGVCVDFGSGGKCYQVCTQQCDTCASNESCLGVNDADGNAVEFRPGVALGVCEVRAVGSGVAYDDCAQNACGQDLVCSGLTGLETYDPFCFPSCTNGEPCPAKEGVSGQCALQDGSGNKYCALVCDTTNPVCPTGMECAPTGQGNNGVCLWPKS